jgi:lipid II:glycine glycyltransferase (peptidoglycan interpeptide bridge formation enzyme)
MTENGASDHPFPNTVDNLSKQVDSPLSEWPNLAVASTDDGLGSTDRVKPDRPDGRGANRDEWHSLAAQFDDHNYQHCWEYAAAMGARWNAKVENLVITSDGELAGLASVRIKPIPGLGTGIAYVPGGPLVRRLEDDGRRLRLEIVLDTMKREYVDRRRLMLRVAPLIGDPEWASAQEQCFRALAFTPSENAGAQRTILIDIDRPSAEVRAGFAQRWRRNLKKAELADLHVREGHDPVLFEDFRRLFDHLVARKPFAVELGADFYAGLQPELIEQERLHVSIASVDGELAAGLVVSTLGDTAVFLLGASNAIGRRTNASYLLQWNAVKAAAARGCRWYDLGGVDAESNPGGYQFKSGMGGIELSAPGPYEIAPSRFRGGAVRATERLVRSLGFRRS